MRWYTKEKAPESFLSSSKSYSTRLLQLLWNRGVKEEEFESFLNPEWERDTHDPLLFMDMEKAVRRIEKAIHEKQKVVIHGDYDTDGVCSAIIVQKALALFGLIADVFLPHREKEGYGLNPKTIDAFISHPYDLVICTDCASSNVDEVASLQNAGIDVIIVDHHTEPEHTPKAYAILNPHFKKETYPFKELCAAGVAFKLAHALLKVIPNEFPQGHEKWFLDFVAVATITDLAVLKGENRVIVKYGLTVLNKTKWPGLQLLIQVAGLDKGNLNEWNIAFQIGPRVNAAGRVDHASSAYKLLQSETQEEASVWANTLNENNASRQEATQRIVEDALSQVKEQVDSRYVLMAHGDWPAGLVGLVASKISERYYRPSLVVGFSQGAMVGSGRSIPSFNIIDAVTKSSEYLERYGGHHQACGFTIKDNSLDLFWNAVDHVAKESLKEQDLERVLTIDMELPLIEVNKETAKEFEKLLPYGIGNSQPKFMAEGVKVITLGAMGATGKHYSFTLEHSGVSRKAVVFEWKQPEPPLVPGSIVDIAYEVMHDTWQGRDEYKVKIIDIRAQ